MKRVVSALIAVVFMISVAEIAHAWFWNKPQAEKPAETVQPQKEEAVQKPAAASKPKPQPVTKAQEKTKADTEKKAQEARQAKRELVEKKRKEMDNMEWEITLSALSGKGKKLGDTVIFKDGMVAFKEFGKKGFAASNFSLKIQEDNSLVWETMQIAEKAGMAFWRGEISPDFKTMRGVLSHKIDDKTKEDFSFVSIGPAKAL